MGKINQTYNKDIEKQARKNLERVAQAPSHFFGFKVIYEHDIH